MVDPKTGEKYLSVDEVAKSCRVHRNAVHKWVKRKQKPKLKYKIERKKGVKPRFVFLMSEIEKFRGLGINDDN